MDLNSIHLADYWIWAHYLYWPILFWSLIRAPWSILVHKDSSNIFFATCAAIFLLWHLKINLTEGIAVHFLGATILTLMFRWQFALIGNALILLGITLTTAADIPAFAMNALLTGVLPIGFSYAVWRLNEWYLPANYFVYVFVAAFLGSGLSILLSGFVSHQILTYSLNELSAEMLAEYLIIFIPIMYSEAFLTGAVISIFVIYKPQWISTFDDMRYLQRK